MQNDEDDNVAPAAATHPPKEGGLILVDEVAPDRVNILPIFPRPIFPHMTIPITFSGNTVVASILQAVAEDKGYLGVALIKEENKEDLYHSELYEVGTLIKVVRTSRINDDTLSVLIQSLHRFRYVRTLRKEPYLRWEIKNHLEPRLDNPALMKPYVFSIMDSVKTMLRLNPLLQEQIKMLLGQQSFETPHIIIDLIASILSADPEKLQALLAHFDLRARAETLLILLAEELELIKLQEHLQAQIKDKIDKQQKEYFLREQLKAIKRELGLEKDDKAADLDKFRAAMAKLTIPDQARKLFDEQLDKLQMLDLQSPEYQVTRNYLSELTALPWGLFSEENLDIKLARKILDEGHYGLQDVKERVLEFISTLIKRGGGPTGSILCFVGPPGVGKTSIGKAIAAALGREYYRFSVGGMRDEAEIKGHRRTYIGAMPGKIMQAMRRTGRQNPLIMIDEIDKIGSSYLGDPSSALLEVLDPEQNKEFLDHFLDVRFDLSRVLFITTANQLDTIPPPLLDRMEVIKLSGYLLQEKVAIAQKHLIRRQYEHHGLSSSDLVFQKSALTAIADKYAREAGVRNFENQIKKIMRKVSLEQTEHQSGKVTMTTANLAKYLGPPLFRVDELYSRPMVGVTLGLAWTAMGGATLYVEASGLKARNAGIKLTGQLGKVMQESAEIAYSYVRSLLAEQKTYRNFFENHRIHLHVPAGATPKDGPSAGITMALALYSLATGRPVRTRLAMTGELTLTGRILPVGGIKEKLIAAGRAKVKEIIFPEENRRDYDELPAYVREGIAVSFAAHFSDVLEISRLPSPPA